MLFVACVTATAVDNWTPACADSPAEIKTQLADKDVAKRNQAIKALRNFNDPQARRLLIDVALNDDDASLRAEAALYAWEMDESLARGSFFAALQHNDPRIRQHAAAAIAEGTIRGLHGRDFSPPLVVALHDDKEAAVRKAVVRALGDVTRGVDDASYVIEPMVKALSVDPDPDVRASIAGLLGEQWFGRDSRAIPALIATLKDDNWTVQWQAALSLSAALSLTNASDPRGLEALIQALEDPKISLRCAAAFALSHVQQPVATQALAKFVSVYDLEKIATEHTSIIEQGAEDMLPFLVLALARYGNSDLGKGMVSDFLNSGNPILAAAARYGRNVMVVGVPAGTAFPQWGQQRRSR